ncbi:MAG TPA: deoxyribose-phosphate aldolase, partial [Thermodesulfovibrionales bacterium]|nr:deoxyribose-phosphate aldolase [Thermodesulfovibrionales bacterium]
DHTLLRPDATPGDIRRLCDEARLHGFFSVCVNPFYVRAAREALGGSAVRTTTVIGFPLGMTLTKVKTFEALESALAGADEIDIVMNVGMAKSGHWDIVTKDIDDVIAATGGIVHKIIIETCYLDGEEKRKASEMVLETGAGFVKTSTGFGPAGVTIEDVAVIKTVVRNRCGIKAAGGIRTLSQVKELISAGATRIGTSAGVAIMEEAQRGHDIRHQGARERP